MSSVVEDIVFLHDKEVRRLTSPREAHSRFARTADGSAIAFWGDVNMFSVFQ